MSEQCVECSKKCRCSDFFKYSKSSCSPIVFNSYRLEADCVPTWLLEILGVMFPFSESHCFNF